MPISMPQTKLWKLADLKPVEYNPREITERQATKLGEGIAEFGLVQPLVVNTYPGREGRIVGGFQRYTQLLAAGETEASVIEVYLELEAEKKLNLQLNRVGGQWNYEALVENFDVADLIDWGFERWDFPTVRVDEGALDTGVAGEGQVSAGTTPVEGGAPPVRMVQLFYTDPQWREYLELIEALGETYGTETPTDTVLAALRTAREEARIVAGRFTEG